MMVKEVIDFENDVLKSKIPVVVDFWAPWCGPCKMLGPVFEKIAGDKSFHGKLFFAKVNVDENSDVAQSVGVMNIPCVVFFKNGEEADRVVGFSSENVLREKISGWVNA